MSSPRNRFQRLLKQDIMPVDVPSEERALDASELRRIQQAVRDSMRPVLIPLKFASEDSETCDHPIHWILDDAVQTTSISVEQIPRTDGDYDFALGGFPAELRPTHLMWGNFCQHSFLPRTEKFPIHSAQPFSALSRQEEDLEVSLSADSDDDESDALNSEWLTAASSSGSDDLKEADCQVEWESAGPLSISVLLADGDGPLFAVAEATWINKDSSIQVIKRLVHLKDEDEDGYWKGKARLLRPKATADGTVQLTVRPLESNDLHLLSEEDEELPTAAVRFLANETFETAVFKADKVKGFVTTVPAKVATDKKLDLVIQTVRNPKHASTENNDDALEDDLKKLHKNWNIDEFERLWPQVASKLQVGLFYCFTDKQLVENCLQETAIDLMRFGFSKASNTSNLRGWLLTVAYRKISKILKRQKKHGSVGEFDNAGDQRESVFARVPDPLDEGDEDFEFLDMDEYAIDLIGRHSEVFFAWKSGKLLKQMARQFGVTLSRMDELRRETKYKLRLLAGLALLQDASTSNPPFFDNEFRDQLVKRYVHGCSLTVMTKGMNRSESKLLRSRLRDGLDAVHLAAATVLLSRLGPRPLDGHDLQLISDYFFPGTFQNRLPIGSTNDPTTTKELQGLGMRLHAQVLVLVEEKRKRPKSEGNVLKKSGRLLLKSRILLGRSENRTSVELEQSKCYEPNESFSDVANHVVKIWEQSSSWLPKTMRPLELGEFTSQHSSQWSIGLVDALTKETDTIALD